MILYIHLFIYTDTALLSPRCGSSGFQWIQKLEVNANSVSTPYYIIAISCFGCVASRSLITGLQRSHTSIIIIIYILIRDGCPFSTFPAHLHLQIHMPTSSLSSYLAASAKSAVTLFRQIVTLRGITLPISYYVYGAFGEHLGRPKIAHGSHNDVRRLCWPNLGCESPLAQTPKGSLCWENLCGCLGGGVCLGALTGVTVEGR